MDANDTVVCFSYQQVIALRAQVERILRKAASEAGQDDEAALQRAMDDGVARFLSMHEAAASRHGSPIDPTELTHELPVDIDAGAVGALVHLSPAGVTAAAAAAAAAAGGSAASGEQPPQPDPGAAGASSQPSFLDAPSDGSGPTTAAVPGSDPADRDLLMIMCPLTFRNVAGKRLMLILELSGGREDGGWAAADGAKPQIRVGLYIRLFSVLESSKQSKEAGEGAPALPVLPLSTASSLGQVVPHLWRRHSAQVWRSQLCIVCEQQLMSPGGDAASPLACTTCACHKSGAVGGSPPLAISTSLPSTLVVCRGIRRGPNHCQRAAGRQPRRQARPPQLFHPCRRLVPMLHCPDAGGGSLGVGHV
jgi:hypothetical protein